MSALENWELLSYVVTVVGYPLAIFVFAYEQRRERENEDESVYQPAVRAVHRIAASAGEHDLPVFMRELMKKLRARQVQESSAWDVAL